jgi:transcriptional regulator with XRE-family HTH domain
LTPGLRREEVAELAGVGTTWYTWMEQARDIRPSERTLRSIARALQLSKPETKYLLDLGLEHAPRPAADKPVAREVLWIVNGMSSPAFVLGRSGNLLAYNLPANALYDFDYIPDRNYFRTIFSPESRAFLINWPEYARNMLAVFRKRSAGVLGDPAVTELVDDLSNRSPEFRQWWAEQEVSDLHTFEYVCEHPFVGRLEFAIVCFGVIEHPDLSVVGLVTEHHDTRQRLAELIRQLDSGEHDATHNLWTAVVSRQSLSAAHGYPSDYP